MHSTLVRNEDVTQLTFSDNYFDTVLCFDVLEHVPDYRAALKEFYRALKPGGKVYICGNGIGFFIHSIKSPRNEASDFDPSKWAADAMANTLDDLYGRGRKEDTPIIIPSSILLQEMKRIGFTELKCAGEGKINISNVEGVTSFYNETEYGYENVYEVLGMKSNEI